MKYKHAIGLDLDHYTMRAVLLEREKHGKKILVKVKKSCEIHGAFIKDSDVLDGLKQIEQELGHIHNSTRIASVLGGKQVFTSKVAFQKIASEKELKKALKYEVRKDMPFESSASLLEFQQLNNGEHRHDGKVDFMVAASTTSTVSRHMRLLGSSNLKPHSVDPLPLMVANTFWMGAQRESVDAANIVVHIGPDLTTLVIDGEQLPYFSRLIYFSAEELFSPGEDEASITEKERDRRIASLAEEIRRSLSYYEENFENVSFSTVNLMGGFTSSELIDGLREGTQLNVIVTNLVNRVENSDSLTPGHHDLAIALALQALE